MRSLCTMKPLSIAQRPAVCGRDVVGVRVAAEAAVGLEHGDVVGRGSARGPRSGRTRRRRSRRPWRRLGEGGCSSLPSGVRSGRLHLCSWPSPEGLSNVCSKVRVLHKVCQRLERVMVIVRTVTVDRPVAEVFAYLSDFTTTEEWDPGTVRTTRVSGDGGVGTTVPQRLEVPGPRDRAHLRRHGARAAAPAPAARREQDRGRPRHDDARRDSRQAGRELTYRAEFEFKGLARLVAPLAAPAFRRLGDEAERGLRARRLAP